MNLETCAEMEIRWFPHPVAYSHLFILGSDFDPIAYSNLLVEIADLNSLDWPSHPIADLVLLLSRLVRLPHPIADSDLLLPRIMLGRFHTLRLNDLLDNLLDNLGNCLLSWLSWLPDPITHFYFLMLNDFLNLISRLSWLSWLPDPITYFYFLMLNDFLNLISRLSNLPDPITHFHSLMLNDLLDLISWLRLSDPITDQYLFVMH